MEFIGSLSMRSGAFLNSMKGKGLGLKALSVKNPYAMQIVQGAKTIEIRSWSTPYRGPLTIVSSSVPRGGNKPEYLNGHALGEVVLIEVRPLPFEDCEAALLKPEWFEANEGNYS